MKENKLTFQSQNLIVDYLEFKFNVLPEFIKQKIVLSFFKLGFNSFDVDKKYRDPIQTRIQTNSKNQYQIQFVVNISSYWNGVCVAFPGNSAALFYQLSKEKKIDWNLFDSANINRFDLNLFDYLVLKVLLNIFIYEISFNNIQFPINEFVILSESLLN